MKQHIDLEQLRTIAQKNDYDTFAEFYRLIRNDKNTSYNSIKRFYDRLRNGETLGFDKLLSEINIGKLIEILNNKTNIIFIECVENRDGKDYWSVEASVNESSRFQLIDALYSDVCQILGVNY